jgi:hypothetical protein
VSGRAALAGATGIAVAIGSLCSAPASAESIISATMSEAPLYVTESAKSIPDLEFCAATALGATDGVPSGVYRDGEDRAVVLAYRHSEYKVFLAITLTRMATGTRVEVRGRNESAARQFIPTFLDCA